MSALGDEVWLPALGLACALPCAVRVAGAVDSAVGLWLLEVLAKVAVASMLLVAPVDVEMVSEAREEGVAGEGEAVGAETEGEKRAEELP